ncbi:MAG: hypothetical protein HC904_15710 [Blastochloris sp.]|nr:hypothetical protein [Blastochloris sp.]
MSRNEWIAMISLLVLAFGVAVPYFMNSARVAARQASAGNLQQWGIALNLFLTEHDNRLPETGGPELDKEDVLAWYNSLPVYLSQSPWKELSAPPQPGQPSLWMDPAIKAGAGGVVFAYAMNAWLQPERTGAPYKIYEIDDPTRVVFLVEVGGATPRALPEEVKFRHGKAAPDPEAAAHVLFVMVMSSLVKKADLTDTAAGQDPKATMPKVSWVPFFEAPEPVEK